MFYGFSIEFVTIYTKGKKRAAVGEASPRAYLQTQPKTDVKCEYLNLIMIPATDKLHNRDKR